MSAMFREGVAAFEEGNFEEARRLFELAVNADPMEMKIRVWLAHTYQKVDKVAQAQEIFEALTTNPDPVVRQVALKGLQQCREQQGERPIPMPEVQPQLRAAPVRPRSVGDIVSAGVQAYRSRFPEFARMSLVAYLWLVATSIAGGVLFAAFVGVFAGVGFLESLQSGNSAPALAQNLGVFLFGLLLALIPAFFGFHALWLRQTLVHGLTFGDLSSDPSPTLTQDIKAKRWTLTWAASTASGLILLPYVGTILVAVLVVALAGAFGGLSEPALGIFAVLLVSLAFVGSLLITLYVAVRLQLVLAALSVENLGTMAAIRRSWDLTKQRFWPSFGVLVLLYMVNTLAALPLNLLTTSSNTIAALVGYVLALILTVLFTPLWWTTTAVLYYDLRARREGLDLLQQLG